MDLVQCTKYTLYKDPFYGHISLGLQKSFSDRIKTACAQIVGINIELFFNEEYYNSLNDKQKVGLMIHELSHVCLFHLVHWDDYEDKQLFNIAADMTINQYIDLDYLPPNAILPSSFPELNIPTFKDTKFYYEFLKQSAGKSPRLDGLLDYLKGGGIAVCSHPLWEESKDGEGNPVSGISDNIKDLVRAQIEHEIKQVYEENFSKNAGSLPGYLRELVLSMYMKTPPVLDWKSVVRQFKAYCDKQVIKLTRTKPNKRFPDFEATTLRQQRKMLVGIDVSGSISQESLMEFYTQIGHMAKHGVEIDIAEWDAGLTRPVYEFNARNPHSKMKGFKGGGGTNPYEVVQYLNKSRNHNACVMLTDGYIGGSWDKKVCKPILWICNAGGTVNFPAWPGKKLLVPNLK